jgi:molecular chaperone IbpA
LLKKEKNMTNQYTLRTLDVPGLAAQIHRHAIGFDNLFEQLTRTSGSKVDNYPPHNIIQYDENHHAIEIAIAGFKEDEVSVEVEDNLLTITGEQQAQPEVEGTVYIHKGISNRTFLRTFTLAEHVEVTDATVQNGILTISLERNIPDEKQTKKVQITFAK